MFRDRVGGVGNDQRWRSERGSGAGGFMGLGIGSVGWRLVGDGKEGRVQRAGEWVQGPKAGIAASLK